MALVLEREQPVVIPSWCRSRGTRALGVRLDDVAAQPHNASSTPSA
jgi:hypothetical protein